VAGGNCAAASLPNGEAPLSHVHIEVIRASHGMLERRIVDLDAAYLIRIDRQPVPDVLDPQNGESGLVGQPAFDLCDSATAARAAARAAS
jgi:hypothetical protein